jgi:hypothetical protein
VVRNAADTLVPCRAYAAMKDLFTKPDPEVRVSTRRIASPFTQEQVGPSARANLASEEEGL